MRRMLSVVFFTLIFMDIFLRVGSAEETSMPSAGLKKMTMVFTRSMEEYSGRWTYLVFTEAFKRMDMEFVFETFPAKRCSFLADEGKVDGELGRAYSYAESHPNLIRVEEPITSLIWAAYTIDPTVKIDGWEGFKGTNYKVEYRQDLEKAGTRLSELVSKEKLSSTNSVSSGLKKLVSGRSDIYVDFEEIVAPFLLSEEFKGSKIRKAGILEEETIHAFLHKRNEAYAPALSAALREMKQEGLFEAYDAVAKKEIGAISVTNKLMNGGFEEVKEGKPNYWRFFGPQESLLLDGDIHVEGKYSIQIYLKQYSKDEIRLEQTSEVEAGKRYDFGGKIKGNLKDGSAKIMVIFLDKEGNEIATQSLPEVIDSNDWSDQHMWVKSPNGADAAKIVCFVKGSGKAWFDDVYLTAKIKGGY